MMPFTIVQRLYQIPAENGQVFLWRFPSPTLQELPQPWHNGSTQRQLGWIVCIAGKQGDLDVGMPFVFHLGKEQKTLLTPELSCLTGSIGTE